MHLHWSSTRRYRCSSGDETRDHKVRNSFVLNAPMQSHPHRSTLAVLDFDVSMIPKVAMTTIRDLNGGATSVKNHFQQYCSGREAEELRVTNAKVFFVFYRTSAIDCHNLLVFSSVAWMKRECSPVNFYL